MSAVQRAKSINKTKRSRHLRGALHPNTNVSRLPQGMPRQERWDARNYYMGHRPGSRIRNLTQRFLQEGRREARRNPARAALRLAPSRNYDNTNIGNISKGAMGWTDATNIVDTPLVGYWGAVGVPIAEARSVASVMSTLEPEYRSESNLYHAWRPLARRSVRAMTPGEMNKEERFRQRAAENAQRRARALYRSPRSISKSIRKVKSLQNKKLKSKSKKRSV